FVFPTGIRLLSFWMMMKGPHYADDKFQVTVDGNTLSSVSSLGADIQPDDWNKIHDAWINVHLDIFSYADGAAHELSLKYTHNSVFTQVNLIFIVAQLILESYFRS